MTSKKIKKGDTVAVVSGKDKGKSGKVIRVERETDRLVVEGANIHHRFEKPRGNKAGERVSFPGSMSISKVMIVCPNCNEVSRVGMKVLEDGTKQRVCKSCQKAI